MGRREKSYSAQSGYVYLYTYECERRRAGAAEYVFAVSADRRTSITATVVLPDDIVAAWEREHGFTLRPNERYGIVKLALFQAFDERPDPGSMREPVLVRRADLAAIVQTLGLLG